MEIENILSQAKEEVQRFQDNNKGGVVAIRGATATGKSKLSVLLSDFFDTEIISADSRQIFRLMDIGTDKISQEIRNKIPHHQIDIVDPDQTYTSGQWRRDTENIITSIHNKNKLPLIVGGTGLYIDTIYKNFCLPECLPDRDLRNKLFAQEDASPGYLHNLLKEIDPEEATKNHPNSTRFIVRALEIFYKTGTTKTNSAVQADPKYPILMLGLRREKEDSNSRIDRRIKEMLATGLIEEVQMLLAKGYKSDLQSMQGIGYKQTIEYLEGKYNLQELEEKICLVTHQFAKRQRTRFRRYINDQHNKPINNVTYRIFAL